MSRSEEVNLDIWKHGVVLSFDFSLNALKKYYSETSPQGAYEVIRKYLADKGFAHLKDSDYENKEIDDIATMDLLYDFSIHNKWFPYCLQKMDISPSVMRLDVSKDIWALRDEEWAKNHFEQSNQIQLSQKDNHGSGTMDEYRKQIAEKRLESESKADVKNEKVKQKEWEHET